MWMMMLTKENSLMWMMLKKKNLVMPVNKQKEYIVRHYEKN
jgi:hypothetical protein